MNGADWFALRTEPRQERNVELRLKRHGVTVFLPTEFRDVRRGKRAGGQIEVAKLPGYLFVTDCSPWAVRNAFRDRGVQGVVGFNGEAGRIPHDRLQRYANQSAAPLIHSRAIVPGRRAELLAPGCEHVVVDVLAVNGSTAKVLMWLFGAQCAVDVKLEHLLAA